MSAVTTSFGSGEQAGDFAVEGVVLDADGLPIPGARVSLLGGDGSVRQTVRSTTDPFRFEHLERGTYSIRVEADGFEPQTLDLQAVDTPAVRLQIRLEPLHVAEQV